MEDEKNLLISIKLDENKIAARLKDINKNIMDLESQNKDLQKAVEGSGDKFGIFAKRIQENNDKIKDLQKQSLDLQNQMSNTASSTDKLNSNLTKLDTGLTNTNKLTGDGSTGFKDYSGSINEASQYTVDFAENNKRLEAVVNQNKAALEKLNESAKNLKSNISDLDDIVVSLSSKPISLDTTNAINATITLKENLLAVADGVEEMGKASVDNLLSGIEKLKSALPVCNQAVEILNQSFKNLGYDSQVNLNGISTAITSIAGIVEGIASENYAQAIVSAIPLIGQLLDYITKKVRELRDGAYEFSGIWSTMDFETTRRAITGVEDQLNKSLNPKASEWYYEFIQFFSKDIPDFFDEVIQFVAVNVARIKDINSKAINWVNDKIRDIFGVDILNGFDDVIIYISAKVNQFFGWVGRQLTSMFNGIANGVDRVISVIGTKAQRQRAEERRERRKSAEEEEKDYEDNLVARAAKERKARRERVRANKEANREETIDYEDNLWGRWAKEREQRRQADVERQQAEIKRKQEAGAAIEEIERLERESDLRREQRLSEIERLNREMQTATCEERKRLEGEILQQQLQNAIERANIEQQKLDTYLETLKKVSVVYDETTGKTVETLVDVEATKEQADIINQLQINLEKANREVENLTASEQQHNATIQSEINIYKQQQALAEKRREYESNEIDRRQQIIELKNQEGNTDQQVLEIQKESLEEKIALIEQEIALQEQKMQTLNANSDSEVEALHRLQMSLKETQNELYNLENGLNTGTQDVNSFGSSFDKLTGDIGTASGALSMLGITGVGAIKKVAMGLKAIGKLFTTWPLVAIAAIITVIATVVKGVSDAFKENEELTKRLHEAFEAFEPILEIVKKSFDLLAQVITLTVEAMAFLVRTILGTQDAWEKEKAWINAVEEATERLNNAKKQYAYDEEERAQEIIELSRIVKDKELKDIDERLAAQRKINDLKLEGLEQDKWIKNQEAAIAEEKINHYNEILAAGKKLNDEQQQEYDDLIQKIDELRIASIKANYAVLNSYAETRDNILTILSELTTKQIEEKITQLEASRNTTEKEIDLYNNVEKALLNQYDTYAAINYLKAKGIKLSAEEAENFEKVLLAMQNFDPSKIVIDNSAIDKQLDELREALTRSKARDAKNKPTGGNTGKSDAEKEAEAYAKYWNDAFDSAEKGLVDFHSELKKAERDFKELSMTKLQIFDLNMEDTMKELDTRKAEIQAKLQEIQNTTTQTPEQEEQKQQSIAYYTEMYESMEALRTQITLKGAQERAKIEQELAKEAQEKIVKEYEDADEEIVRRYKAAMLEARESNPMVEFGAELDPIKQAEMELQQAKDQLELLKATLATLDPASEAYAEFADKIVDASQTVIDKQKELNDSIVNTATQYTDAFANIAGSINTVIEAQKNEIKNSKKSKGEKEALLKELETKQRAATIAQIAFSSASALAQGIASAMQMVYPLNIIAMISTIASVLASIATAKAQMSGYAEGGIIPGTSYSGDRVQARVNSGEMVLTQAQQKQLFEIANGRGSQGMNYELMVSAFTNAVERMPSPTLDYQEFTTFVNNVDNSNNLVKLK